MQWFSKDTLEIVVLLGSLYGFYRGIRKAAHKDVVALQQDNKEIKESLATIDKRLTHMEGAFSMFGYIFPPKPNKKTGTEGK